MAKITIEYCKNNKAYDGRELKSGQVLAPVLFSEEMIKNDDTVIRNNLRTWTLYSVKFKVGFLPVDEEDFDRIVSIFHFQINGYFEEHPEHRPGRCLIGFNEKGFPRLCGKENRCTGCPRRGENLPRYKNLEDYVRFISLESASVDENGEEIPLDVADTSQMPVDEQAILETLFMELMDSLERTSPRYTTIARLSVQGMSKEDIFKAIHLRTSSGYAEFAAFKKAVKKFFED